MKIMAEAALQSIAAPKNAPSDHCWIDHPSGYLALSPPHEMFRLQDQPGFIAFRTQGKHVIAFGGVHAPAEHRGPLLDAFLSRVGSLGKIALFVQVREDCVPL